ncbi:MAG: bifunctional biotin--[acetyl-CoA-carboxylase] ligase/biotin operon repressor BirA [Colwellia sp.]|nr:bifunctional biotin--[acetyl-CoA-carboxylase] ligase/biotin operon repressor BirA [Colwellia sp.]
MAKAIKELLIQQLAKGEFVSGQLLGEQLGVSRTAVAKHVKSLSDMGLDVFRVTGKGYKLAEPLILLDKDNIVSLLADEAEQSVVEVHNIIDSTNNYLMRRLPNQIQNGQVCFAEYQSAGRGRRGRQWISPFGSHIYMSMYWYLEQGMSAAMGLSTVAALAVSDAIKKLYNVEVQLKWPNDIYLKGVKLAGILIDLDGQTLEPCHCVIGIGINLNMPDKSAEQVDQPWTDLQANTTVDIDRNQLAAELINCLTKRLQSHQINGLNDMVTEWRQQDYFYNKDVKLITGQKETIGICQGINEQGALLLEVDGNIKAIYGGEVSLRGLS